MSNQNKNFEYNLPLQAYRDKNGDIQILNYMPRKNSVAEISLQEFNETNMNEKDLFYGVSTNLLNLAILFKKFADKEIDSIYYHNKDIDKNLPPMSYANIVDLFLKSF